MAPEEIRRKRVAQVKTRHRKDTTNRELSVSRYTCLNHKPAGSLKAHGLITTYLNF